jgi:hypothetical protein
MRRSCFYDSVSTKTAENGDRMEKLWTLQGLSGGRAFKVFHLKCGDSMKYIVVA